MESIRNEMPVRKRKPGLKQYCRYCSFCFAADDYRCSNHPNGFEPHWTREQINRQNNCPNFDLSPLGDVDTGKMYKPKKQHVGEQLAGQMKMDI